MEPDQLRELYPRAPDDHIESFAARSDELLARFDITASPTRLEYFLAQIGHESGGLTITTENLNYSAPRLCQVWPTRFADLDAASEFAGNPEKLANNVYASRMGNGSPESGDGWRYRGRGYIQITGRDGYESVGDIAGLDLVGEPDLASTAEQALLVACSFWEWKNINLLCEPGGFAPVTRRINGGTNGMADRRQWLGKVTRVLGHDPATMEEPTTAEIIDVQRALQDAGYSEVGAADGLMGPRTRSAIQQFRRDNGLPSGLIDDALKRALGTDD